MLLEGERKVTKINPKREMFYLFKRIRSLILLILFNSFSNCLWIIFRYLRMYQDTFMVTFMTEFRQIHGEDYFLPCKLKEEDCNLISTSHGWLGLHQGFQGFSYK